MLRILKWAVLIMLSVVMFVTGMHLCCPISTAPAREVSSVVLSDDGNWIYAQTNKNEKWRFDVNISKIDPLYTKILIAYEDQRYWHHLGVDPLAMVRAMFQLVRSGRVISGGSTITMQLARLLEPKPRTVRSKIIEILRAFELEMFYSKNEILRDYLVLAPYGGNVEGLVAASMRYFGKPPYSLSADEAALLVSLPKSPEMNSPIKHPKQSKKARNKVLALAFEKQTIGQNIYKQAISAPLPSHIYPYPRYAPHLSQRLLSHYKKNEIETTLNIVLQKQLEQWALSRAASLEKGTTISVLIAENNSSSIKAYLGSHNMFSKKVAGFVDMIRTTRSPGSALKPFIYGLGFEKHIIHPNTLAYDTKTRFGDYLPHNYSREYNGEVTMRYALQHSLNIPAVKLLKKLGVMEFTNRLSSVAGKLKIPGKRATLPIALGGMGISIWQMTQLYTALANGGSSAPLHYLYDKYQFRKKLKLLEPEAAKMVTSILRTVTPPDEFTNPGHRIAFKTGTSYGYRDLWTMAYTPGYTVAVWVGRPDNGTQLKHSGREIATPMAFEIIGILDAIHQLKQWGWSPNYLNAKTPNGLLYLERQTKEEKTEFDFIYPQEGAKYRSAGCHDTIVKVETRGGVAPKNWYLDGNSMGEMERSEITIPLRTGAHHIAIIDNRGETIKRSIWVFQPDCNKQ